MKPNNRTISLEQTLRAALQHKIIGFPIWFHFFVATLSVVKLWLVSGQHLYAVGYNIHDDRLFINLANNILNSLWLGNYNEFTLMKGPFYPMWIAFSNTVHIPLFYSQHLLYILASVCMIVALRPLFYKSLPTLSLFFSGLLFNPMSFADGPSTRALREGIYPALAILIIASFTGMLLRSNNTKRLFLWSAAAGISLSCFWLTREEGIWILPFAIIISAALAISIWRGKDRHWKIRIMSTVFPFIILYASISGISLVNYRAYGIYNTVEFKEPSFLNSYGALTRVKAPVWMADVPVSTAQLNTIYSVSPTFSKLRVYFDGDLGKMWSQFGNPKEPNEIKGGWFMWAFRDATAQAGYYKNGKKAMHFYQKIADEINSACDSGAISCYATRSTMMSPWNSNYNAPAVHSILHGMLYTAKFDDFTATPSASVGDSESLALFTKVAGDDVTKKADTLKVTTLNIVGELIAFLSPIATLLALIIFLYQCVFINKNVSKSGFILSFAIIASFFGRIVGLALISTTAFPAMNSIYLSSVYPLLFIFVALNLAAMPQFVKVSIVKP